MKPIKRFYPLGELINTYFTYSSGRYLTLWIGNYFVLFGRDSEGAI